jgi:arylamine N-acetyltransferase
MLDAATRDQLLRRIGLTEVPAAGAAGLRTVHRAFVSRVPYENIAVQQRLRGDRLQHAPDARPVRGCALISRCGK